LVGVAGVEGDPLDWAFKDELVMQLEQVLVRHGSLAPLRVLLGGDRTGGCAGREPSFSRPGRPVEDTHRWTKAHRRTPVSCSSRRAVALTPRADPSRPRVRSVTFTSPASIFCRCLVARPAACASC